MEPRQTLWFLGWTVLMSCDTGSSAARDGEPNAGVGGAMAAAGASASEAGSPATIAIPEGPIISLAYDSVWGPCRPEDLPCEEHYVVLANGSLTETRGDVIREAALSDDDQAAFGVFLSDPVVARGIIDSRPCGAPVFDWTETVSLEFETGESASKHVTACDAEPYTTLRTWVERFRSYFSG